MSPQIGSRVISGLAWLAAGVVTLVLGAWEMSAEATGSEAAPQTVIVLVAAAVGLSRWLPSVSLGLMAFTGAMHLWGAAPLMLIELGFCVVMFAAARWGHWVTVAAAPALLAAAAPVAVALLGYDQVRAVYWFLPSRAVNAVDTSTRSWQLVATAAGATLLLVPWMLGLILRLIARAQQARAAELAASERAEQARLESEQAIEIARLEEARTQLAHDVHDVVGHSLAVILAQAESGQYAEDPDALKRTMATIATSARGSLQDVRQVLQTGTGGVRSLDQLVAGVRDSGREVIEEVHGSPRPLPPELEAVGYRVLQEMLTNALRHSPATAPISITWTWGEALALTVSNPWSAREPMVPGQGVAGMRRRLVAVGGSLEVHPDIEAGRFSVTATMPVRGEGR